MKHQLTSDQTRLTKDTAMVSPG
ncbi:uncharacterized protein METZ01_LOCUS107553 [marine metagenome]|uniref:Uncharacterized protein n=1 Tax=marine metagenome TaxID=408172 RepID=A0A381WQA4_9ZZZZ